MKRLQVEVVYALSDRQWLKSLTVAVGSTVADAIAESGISRDIADEKIDAAAVGVWGQETSRDRALQDGDRIEIYRPLELDPKEARRRLALSGQTMSSAQIGEDHN